MVRVLFESMRLHAPLLLTWYIFNTDMDKWSHAQERVGWNYAYILKV